MAAILPTVLVNSFQPNTIEGYMDNDPNAPHCCLVCRKRISWQFAICNKCEEEYGHSSKEWPAWLRFLWADTLKTRRRDQNIKKYEVTESDLEDPDDPDE